MEAVLLKGKAAAGHWTLYDRVSQLLQSFEWSDCSFIVGGEIIRGHRLILAISSPVFKAMLYGPMAASEDIVIPDIDPQVFQLLLDFIYTDKIQIDSIDVACGLLYAAKKYMIPYLEAKALSFIKENTSIDNVILIFDFADWIQEKQLYSYCLNLLCQHANIILKNNINKISGQCLKAMLLEDHINIKEIDLIKDTLMWAKGVCVDRDITCTVENIHSILKEHEILHHLRFLTLTSEEFDSLIEKDHMLLSNEIQYLKRIGYSNETDLSKTIPEKSRLTSSFSHLCLKENHRKKIMTDWYFLRRDFIRSASPLLIDETHCSVSVGVKCQISVFIDAISIPSQMLPQITFSNEFPTTYSEHITVQIHAESDKVPDRTINFINTVKYNETIFIELCEPYVFNKNVWYLITFTWPEKNCQVYKYPLSYRFTNCFHKVVFDFKDFRSNNLNSGSFLEGLKFSV